MVRLAAHVGAAVAAGHEWVQRGWHGTGGTCTVGGTCVLIAAMGSSAMGHVTGVTPVMLPLTASFVASRSCSHDIRIIAHHRIAISYLVRNLYKLHDYNGVPKRTLRRAIYDRVLLPFVIHTGPLVLVPGHHFRPDCYS